MFELDENLNPNVVFGKTHTNWSAVHELLGLSECLWAQIQTVLFSFTAKCLWLCVVMQNLLKPDECKMRLLGGGKKNQCSSVWF